MIRPLAILLWLIVAFVMWGYYDGKQVQHRRKNVEELKIEAKDFCNAACLKRMEYRT